MKCLYIAGAAQCSGASLALLDLILALRKYHVEAVVILKDSGPFCDLLRQHEIRFFIANYSPWVKAKANVPLLGWLKDRLKTPINMIAEQRIKAILRQEQPDIVHLNSIMCATGFTAAKKLGLPTAWHIREMLWEDHRHEFINPEHSYALISSANAVITISECVTNKYRSLIPHANIKRIFDGLPVPTITDSRLNQPRDTTQPIQLILAGRISAGKGQLEAVTAIGLLPSQILEKINLLIIGQNEDPDLKDQLDTIIEQKNLQKHIQIKDFTHDITQLWRQVDITLMCSKAEAFGRVTVEGMLLETIVIASNTGANPELINDGVTGFLYQQGSPQDLADKITHVAHQIEQLGALKKHAREHAIASFSIEKHASEIYSLYQDITQQ